MATYRNKAYLDVIAARRGYLKSPAQRKVQSLVAMSKEKESKSDPHEIERIGHTVGRVGGRILTGALKSVEGLVDATMGVGGAAAGIFSKEAQDKTRELIKFDATEEWIGKHINNLTQYSYTGDGKVGEILENVASGVGQMLPAVAVSILTAGAAAPSMGTEAAAMLGQKASLAALSVGAAGTSSEEAYRDGAEYYKGLGYGAVRGGTEALTEKLVGNKLIGSGVADKVLKGGVKTRVGDMAVDAVGEAAEEAFSELANPLTKAIYKGRDGIREYGEGEYWKGVGDAALVGGLTSAAFSGTVGMMLDKGDSRLNAATEKRKEINQKFANGEGSAAELHAELGKTFADMEATLKNMSGEKRAKMIESYGLSSVFASDGSVKPDFYAKTGFKGTEGQTPTNDKKTQQRPSLEYQSPSLWLNPEKVESDLADINEQLNRDHEKNGGNGMVEEVKAFAGKLSKNGQTALAKLKKAAYHLSERSQGGLDMVIVEPNQFFNGALHNGTMYLSADALEKGSWLKTLIEETTHFAEGTREYAKYVSFLAEDPALFGEALENIVDTESSKKGYGFTEEMAERAVDKQKAQPTLAGNESSTRKTVVPSTGSIPDSERKVNSSEEDFLNEKERELLPEWNAHASADLLGGDEAFVDKLIRENTTVAEKLLNLDNAGEIQYNKKKVDQRYNFSFLHKNFPSETESQSEAHRLAIWWVNRSDVEVGDQTLISMNDRWYLVERFDDSDNGYRVEKFVYKHEFEKILKELKEHGRSGKVKSIQGGTDWIDRLNQSSNSFRRKESSVDRDISGHGRENPEVLEMDTFKAEGRERSGRDGDGDRESGSTDRQGDFIRDLSEALTSEEKEFLSELNGHMSASLLGTNEEFIDRLVRSDTTIVEKILNRISDLTKAWKSITDPEIRKEYLRLKKAEKLFLNAVSKAGRQYVNGKIVMRREEEEELDYQNLGRDVYYKNSKIYSYDFLIAQKDMQVSILPEISEVVDENGKIVRSDIVEKGLENAEVNGQKINDVVYVKNNYTQRDYSVSVEAIRHSLGGDRNRLLTNARIASIVGEVIKNGIPINGLKNTNSNVEGTYALATLTQDSDGKQYVSISTVEQRTNRVVGIEDFDVVHAVSGRQKNSRDTWSGTKPQGKNPPTNISATISISHFLDIVNSTYQSILSEDVLNHLGSQRNPSGYYTDRVLFSRIPSSNQQDSSSWQEANESFLREYSQAPTSSEQSDTTKKPRKKPTEKSQYKVYSKQDAVKIIEEVISERLGFGDYYGELKGGKKQDVVTALWKALNEAEKGKQLSVVEKVAEYILQSSTLEYIHTDLLAEEKSEAMEIISFLKPYLHKINLENLKGEIKHRYDKKQKSVYLMWGKRKGEKGLGIDQIAEELREQGYWLEGENEADLLFSLHEAYRNASQLLKKEAKVYLNETLSKEEYLSAKNEIVNEILRGFDYTGKYPQISFREKYQQTVQALKADVAQGEARLRAIQGENERLSDWANRLAEENEELTERLREQKILHREEQKDTLERVKVLGNLMHLAGKMKDLKLGTFLNASQYKSDTFKSSVEALARINFRGNLNVTGTRKIIGGLREWYQTDNPLLCYTNESNPGLYCREIAEGLEWIAKGEGKGLSIEELRCLRDDIMPYFIHMVENYNRVYKNGAYEEALPLAKKYVDGIQKVKHSNNGMLKSFRAYFRNFGDPASIMRFADQYDENGFFTETFEELRGGAIGAAETEMDLTKEWNDFFAGKKNNAITNKKEEAPTNYGVSGPVGNRIQNASSTDSIPDSERNVKSQVDKLSDKRYNGDVSDFERGALLAYKSGGSYVLNARLRGGVALGETENFIVEQLDSALNKLPAYRGRVYRNIQFDGLGDSRARDEFVAQHIVGEKVHYQAYTSTSTVSDGYPLEGRYQVHFVIDGQSGRDMDGFGNNFEKEILFARDTIFEIADIKYSQNGTPTIYMKEILYAGEQAQTAHGGRTPRYVSRNNSGESRSSTDAEEGAMQRLRTFSGEGRDMSILSERDSQGNNDIEDRVQTLRGEVTPKQYRKHFTKDTVTYNGAEIPVRVALSLYMTLKRRQAWAALCQAGGQMSLDGERTKIPALIDPVDLSKKIRDTADRMNGLERPKPNEGYALENDISNRSISDSEENVKTFDEKKATSSFTNGANRLNGEGIRDESHLFITNILQNALNVKGKDGKKSAMNSNRAESIVDVKLTEGEMQEIIEDAEKELYDQFTEQDKRLIRIVESAFGECSSLKENTDMLRFGRSNVMKMGYYFPIRRANVAQNVDHFLGEVDRVSHLGFNRDTVQGAAGELLIEPLDTVFMRHIKGISMYANLAVPTDNLNRLLNLNTVENRHVPVTVLSELKNNPFGQDMYTYLDKLKRDIEGIPTDEKDIKEFNRVIGVLRSGYAKNKLGANPKVWLTQLSSLAAATSLLSYDSVVMGIGVPKTLNEVDQYCKLAELRNNENSVALAQGVIEKTGKVGDVLMKPIGWMDRLVVSRLFGACQIQVQKDQGKKLGTAENKKAAGELLTKVILETQQNSIATERSSAMRSGNELMKSFTMFSADAMKVTGRLIDSIGRVSVLRQKLKNANAGSKQSLQVELKRARNDFRKALGAMVISAIMMAAIGWVFRKFYRRDKGKDTEEIAWETVGDFFGNMIGGLPILRDVYSYYVDGYELENFLYSTVNDTLEAFGDVVELISGAADGAEITNRDVARSIRKLMYAASQLVGIPARNAYNVTNGVTHLISPEAGYRMDSWFYEPKYRSDLAKAIEAGDDKMVSTVASLMTGERLGSESEAVVNAIRRLIEAGYVDVLPRALGESITYRGTVFELNAKQKERFREVYDIADESVDALVRSVRFKEASPQIQAKAIRFIYDAYYDLAVEDLLGEENGRNTLFAEAINLEQLALIVCAARMMEADKDRNGNSISGSKKEKIIRYIESLRLSAAQKYMILGYLGYRNLNGKAKVTSYVNSLNLTKKEKLALMEYSGYEVA